VDKLKVLYMFLDETADSAKHRAVIETPSVTMTVIAVSSREEAVKTAQDNVTKGCHLIELCGACGYEGAHKVRDAVGDKVPVGMMVHQFDNAPKICELIKNLSL
jgi:hypothetical protein